MLYAVVARSPVLGGKVVRYDAAEALKIPGVVKVLQIKSACRPRSSTAQWMGCGRDGHRTASSAQCAESAMDDGVHGSYDSKAYRPSWSRPRASRAKCCAKPVTSTVR